MKLRLEPGSIRLRASEEEIDRFHSGETLRDDLNLGEFNSFSFVLKIDKTIEKTTAYFSCDMLIMSVPEKIAEKWLNSNQVGIYEEMEDTKGEKIKLVVELDLPPKRKKD